MFPSPSEGPPLLSESWSPPFCCGMPPLGVVGVGVVEVGIVGGVCTGAGADVVAGIGVLVGVCAGAGLGAGGARTTKVLLLRTLPSVTTRRWRPGARP
jgi:hypothetical protein